MNNNGRDESGRFVKGRISEMKGKHGVYSEETLKRMSESHKGRKVTDEVRKRLSKINSGKNHPQYGIKRSEETRKKLSLAGKGRITSAETRKKLSDLHKGSKRSDETKKLLSQLRTGSLNPMYGITGENHHSWKGGLSFEPYCPKFNNKFKELIRDKFDRKCFLCDKSESEIMKSQREHGKQAYRLSVHHVDYNKDCLCNDIKCEFVPLCHSCHIKTNHNRDYYENLILEKLSTNMVL